MILIRSTSAIAVKKVQAIIISHTLQKKFRNMQNIPHIAIEVLLVKCEIKKNVLSTHKYCVKTSLGKIMCRARELFEIGI